MRSETHRLFFALRPPAPVAVAIEQVADKLKATRLVHGSWLKPAKYHITLQFLGTYDHFPADVHARAVAAAAAAVSSAKHIELDHIASFRGHHQPPCVLRCSARAELALQELARELGRALAAAGLRIAEAHAYTPHLTIGYGDRALSEPIPIEPLAWPAHEFLLIDSHVGDGWHEELARWPLSA